MVTVSPSGANHAVGRLLGLPWVAHVAGPLDLDPVNRWLRMFDPRSRAMRAAAMVTGPPEWTAVAHGSLGAVVAGAEPGPPLAALLSGGAPHDRAGVLMLGPLNTPHVEHLAMAMARRGHGVDVGGNVTPVYPPPTTTAAGIPTFPLQLPALLWVRRLISRRRPDVVHTHWLSAYGFLAALAGASPLIVTAWGSDVYGASPWQLRQCRFAVRHADVAMSDSHDLLDQMAAMGAPRDRLYLLNWGVDLGSFSPPPDRAAVRRQLGLGDGPLILSPRALIPLYNPRVILEAFAAVRARFPDAQLVLKHIGTDEPDLGGPLPEGVHVIGHVPYEQMSAYFRAADVCVSIPDTDSAPRSVWEAMAAGCACVISDLPWTREQIVDGRDALLVPPAAGALTEALERLLGDPEASRAMGAAARHLVEEHHDEQRQMDDLSALYERLAAR